MGNIVPRARIEPISLTFRLHHLGSVVSSFYPRLPVYAAPCLRAQCGLLHLYIYVCMYVCVRSTYAYMCVSTCAFVYMWIYMRICKYVDMCACGYVYMYAYVHIYMCRYVDMCACGYVYMYAYVHMYIYIYIYVHTMNSFPKCDKRCSKNVYMCTCIYMCVYI